MRPALSNGHCIGAPQRPLRRNLFGRPDLAASYRKAKDLFYEHELGHIAQFEDGQTVKKLTICNLWRVERREDGKIQTFEFCLNKKVWEEVFVCEDWPHIPFAPVSWTKGTDWWSEVVISALNKALNATGFYDLPVRTEDPSVDFKPEMNKWVMSFKLRKRVLRKVNSASKRAGCRFLTSVFFSHFLDEKILSAMMVMRPRVVTVSRYLEYARYRKGLLKVAGERRNMLPLLLSINPEMWSRDDLFSRNLWVRSGRKSTALDRHPLGLSGAKSVEKHNKAPIQSFEQTPAWRWLCQASIIIVRAWSEDADQVIVTNLASANVSVKAPVCVYVRIIKRYAPLIQHRGVASEVQSLLRWLLVYAAFLWKEKGLSEVRNWIDDTERLDEVFEWLNAEGFSQGQPNKQSTWESLKRRAADWRKRDEIERMRMRIKDQIERLRIEGDRKKKPLEGDEDLRWSSLVPEIVIDGITFAPLCDAYALAKEGYEMAHCVRDFARDCYKGLSRIFAIREPNGVRYTMAIDICGSEVFLDQMHRKYKRPGSVEACAAVEKLLVIYQRALVEDAQKRVSQR